MENVPAMRTVINYCFYVFIFNKPCLTESFLTKKDTMTIEAEDNDEHLLVGLQQCQEALVSEGLKMERVTNTSQDIKH